MTGMLKVDTADLTRIAERVRLAAAQAQAASADSGPVQAPIAQLADPSLMQATSSFFGHWSGALSDIVGDARRLADAIDLVARAYRDAESAAARSFSW
jgi:uncharacterized protein YukE